MPLSSRARIEVYLPDTTNPIYRHARRAFEREFLETFGGCTVIKDIKGLYANAEGGTDRDKIVLIYADTPFDFRKNRAILSQYTDELRDVAFRATNEESILIVVHEIYHSL